VSQPPAQLGHVIEVAGHRPVVDPTAFVAPGAVVAGWIQLGANTSVWFHAVVRSEAESIAIGEETNLQDGVVVHADPGSPVRIGQRVTVGHRAVIHGCTIGDDVMIGMGAVVLNGAIVGDRAVIGAGAVVTEGTVVPPDSVAVGVPARVRDLPLPPSPRPNVAGYRMLAGTYSAVLTDPTV